MRPKKEPSHEKLSQRIVVLKKKGVPVAEHRERALDFSMYGWCGKILKVDLSSEVITEIDTQPYADRFLGGRGIATRLYWENVPASTKAFDPENHLIFMTGPITATGAQGASRFSIAGKSPMLMPEGFCYGTMGGYWGA